VVPVHVQRPEIMRLCKGAVYQVRDRAEFACGSFVHNTLRLHAEDICDRNKLTSAANMCFFFGTAVVEPWQLASEP
jgi:hypothetical protein